MKKSKATLLALVLSLGVSLPAFGEIKVPSNIGEMSAKDAYLKGYEDGKNSVNPSGIPSSSNTQNQTAIMKKLEKAKVLPVGEIGKMKQKSSEISLILMKNDQIKISEGEKQIPTLSVYLRGKSSDGAGLYGTDSLSIVNYYLVKDGKAMIISPIKYDGDHGTYLQDKWNNYRIDFQVDGDKDFKLDGTETFVIELDDSAIAYQMKMVNQ